MTRILKAILISTTLTWSIASLAVPPIWDADFGPEIGPLSDDDEENQTLGFMFPFDGMMYDSISIGSNGGIMLGNGGVYAGDAYTDYDLWEISYFESDFTDVGNPAILPFNTDLDPGFSGMIHFKTDATTAVTTWDSVVSFETNVEIIDFQVTLAADGTIIFGYDGPITADLVTDLDEGIVVGVSNGMDVPPPASSDLSAPMNADPTAKTTLEIWCNDENFPADPLSNECYITDGSRPDNYAFDLDQTNVIFTPNATGGFDVSTSAAPPPPPPPPPVVDSGEILGDYGGCTVGVADGTLDPTLPLLVLISLFYLLMRRRAEA